MANEYRVASEFAEVLTDLGTDPTAYRVASAFAEILTDIGVDPTTYRTHSLFAEVLHDLEAVIGSDDGNITVIWG